jgi:hypothetical protein
MNNNNIEIETKQCKMCGIDKPVELYSKYRKSCKHCVMVTQNAKSKEIKRNYYYRNQERLLEYKRNYRLNKINNKQDEITSTLN